MGDTLPDSDLADSDPAYSDLVRTLPVPTPTQIRAFAHHVSNAHSWYKHLPWFPPGAPVHVFLDPAAGMQQVVFPDGTKGFAPRESRIAHASELPTEDYRARFANLVFVQPRIVSSKRLEDGRSRPVTLKTRPRAYDVHNRRPVYVPAQVVAAGTALVTGVIHAMAADPALWIMALRGVTAPDPWTEGAAHLGRLLEGPSPLPVWPEESGGSPRLAAIIAHLMREGETRASKPSSLPFGLDEELQRLIEPEQERQRREIVQACERMLDTVQSLGCRPDGARTGHPAEPRTTSRNPRAVIRRLFDFWR